MTQANMNIVLAAGGISIQGVFSRNGEGQIGQEVPLPAAESGTLSTRTSDTDGTSRRRSWGRCIWPGASATRTPGGCLRRARFD